MSNYILAPRAKEDLKSIGRYTQKTWDVKQRNKYLLSLEAKFEWLAKNSKSGKHWPEIKEGYFSFPHERHTIFYLIQANEDIAIIGVVGPGQSLDHYFN